MASLITIMNKFNSLKNQIGTRTNPSNCQKYVVCKKIRCQSLHSTKKKGGLESYIKQDYDCSEDFTHCKLNILQGIFSTIAKRKVA